MREHHPVFDTSVENDRPVWRYFDFPKFVSFLEKRALYFSRADLLGDPLEGSFTKARAAEREELLANPPEGRTKEDLESVFRHNASYFESMPKATYINCWHVGDHESMAMWQGYGGGPYGIAIRSSFGVLDAVLPHTFNDKPLIGPGTMDNIFLGRVRYLDYSSVAEQIPKEYNAYAPFVCKSVAYQHEREIRAIFIDYVTQFNGCAAPGRFIPVNIDSLVQYVTVSPLAPAWFDELVKSVCTRFQLSTDVGRSTVFTSPIF